MKGWLRRLLMLIVVGMFTLLVVAGIMPNPLPPIWDWINRERPIAAADLEWQDRLGGRPAAAAVVGTNLAVDAGRKAQLRELATGQVVAEWTGDWLTTAGAGEDSVVITGEFLSRGYQVRDPDSGTVLHEDDHARAVWGFREARLDLRCDGARSCELRAYRPSATQPMWSVGLPGADAGLLGADPELATARVDVPSRISPRVDGPAPLPPLLGIPTDRGHVAVVHTATGQLLAQLSTGSDEMVIVVGDRVIRSTVVRRDGICHISATGYEAMADRPVWGPEPYNLRTVTGGGCEQRNAPVGAGAALVAVGPDGNELVIDAGDGRVLWRGGADERVQALTEDLIVVRGADPTTRYAVALGGDGVPRWERTVAEDAGALLARCGVVVADQDPNRLHVWDPLTGADRLSVRTSARLLACGPDGMVLADGRSIALASFTGARDDPSVPVDGK